MAVRVCGTLVTDARGKELAEHGSSLFPVACYDDPISEMPVPWHWHPEWEAIYVKKGAARVSVNGESRMIKQGEGIFINAGALHDCQNAGGDRCLIRSLVFHPRLVGGSVDSILWQKYVDPLASGPACIPLRGEADWEQEAIGAVQESWAACAAEEEGFEFAVRQGLSRLVFLLRKNCLVEEKLPSKKSQREGERVKIMLQYIQENLAEELTLADIARSAAISKNECLRCFRSMLGSTPIRYLQELRVQWAAERLANTAGSISEIAAACGFQETSYFARLFRRVKGCTPSEYRKNRGAGQGTV